MAADKGGIKAIFNLIAKTTGITDGKLPITAILNWLSQSGLIGKDTGITESDVTKTHAKNAEDRKKMTIEELQECILNVAKEKQMDPKELMDKLASAGPPQMEKVQEVAKQLADKFSK